MKRRSRAAGLGLVGAMVVSAILGIVALAIAQLAAWITTSSKYTRAYDMRAALEGTLRTALINPRVLCKSLNKVVESPPGTPLNPTISGNESFTKCVTKTNVGAPTGTIDKCHADDLGGAINTEKQYVDIWDEAVDSSGARKRIAGGDGTLNPLKPDSAPGAKATNPVFYDLAGKQCDAALTPTDGKPNEACPFRVTSSFKPVCKGGGSPCATQQASLLSVYYRIETYEKIPGGAPLAPVDNKLSAEPVEVWRILSACGMSVTLPTDCPTGQYVKGTDKNDGSFICGYLPSMAGTNGTTSQVEKNCPNAGEVLVGFQIGAFQISPSETRETIEPVCACPAGTSLAGGQCQGIKCAPPGYPSLLYRYSVIAGLETGAPASTVGGMKFKCTEADKEYP